jgi:predicted solute-binding protein
MYVNEFTRDYGEVGREAIRRFLREARERDYVDREVSIDFVK